MINSDEQLVLQAVAGDERALCALLERHGPIVRDALQRAYHRRLKGEVELDDIMQVTYLEAFLRIGAFISTGPASFGAWLRRIAENNLRDAIRKSDAADRRRSPGGVGAGGARAANPDSCRGLVELVAGGDSPIHLAGRCETERLLEAALRQLPADYERVLRLYDLEGHNGPEVARLMGRSHGAVKMLMARARDRLGEVLGSGSKFFSRGG